MPLALPRILLLQVSLALLLSLACRPGLEIAPTAALAEGVLTQQENAPMAPDFPATLEWLNTDRPLSLKDLRGKIVLLDFWTQGCINCIHVIPDLKKLEAKYPNELVVIGVHSAKFTSEKETERIRESILRYDLEHPVVNDRDFVVWRAYGVDAWPTLFLIDPDGRVAGYKSGEGVFEPFDRAIAALIAKFDPLGKLDRRPLRFVLEKEKRPKSVLSYPAKIAADETGGRLFLADTNHHRIIMLGLDGAVLDVIGSGEIGLQDGDFGSARFHKPHGMSYDRSRDTLYVADKGNHALRAVHLGKRSVTTLAGTGEQAGWPPRGGIGTQVALSSPWDVLAHGDRVYIAMAGIHQLWVYNLKTQQCGHFVGAPGENLVDGPHHAALLAQPTGLATDGNRLYFADSESSAIRSSALSDGGSVRTYVGQGLFEWGDKDGAYPNSRVQHAQGVAVMDGVVYVADTYNNKIKRLDPKSRVITTLVGTGEAGMRDGEARRATLYEPGGLTWARGRLYIADTNNHLVRVYDPADGKLTTLRLKGIERLTRRPQTRLEVEATEAEPLSVQPSASHLELRIALPNGTKFTPDAPFVLNVSSSDSQVVSAQVPSDLKPAERILIPWRLREGSATITLEIAVNFCDAGNEGKCYFRESRLKIPVVVASNGATGAVVNHAVK